MIFRILALSFVTLSASASLTLQAQQLKVNIAVPSAISSHAVITCEYSEPITRLSFTNIYGNVLGLGDRIEHVEVWEENRESNIAQRVAPGEFRASVPVRHFRYSIKLDPPEKEGDMAHVSWLAGDMGYLMLDDLLPSLSRTLSIIIDFNLPPGWKIASLHQPSVGPSVETDAVKAVYFVGRSLRTKTRMARSTEITLVTASQWSFTDDQVLDMMDRILRRYERNITAVPGKQAILLLAPFPTIDGTPRWNAETRGSTTAIVFNEGDRRTALAQLAIALSHELFHLWVPNALALTGDYDWFFEGFTLYQALHTAVDLRFIDFDEYLKTVSRVYQSYRAHPDGDQFSLIEASRRRFTGGAAAVYDKAMLLAFICDLAIRAKSDGKLSIDDVYRSLFKEHGGKPRDANQVIITTMSGYDPVNQLIKSYALGNAAIELDGLINQYGLSIQSSDLGTQVVINRTLNSTQRRLLRSLGFRH